MPANPKYLTTSNWVKASKITAAILGSLIATLSFHLALASWFNPTLVWGTSVFSLFILWLGFILLTYWVRKAWHIWSILSAISLISVLAIYLGQST
ncbi:hypothetical protein [Chondrinema litorale]|uniref:hypothetical protein n=1 Tax=Chondrinema litorale TaxID=2994555 RepID=UPI00254389FF|nr:hypothetical protein [Chondrinema litorale]UZR96361.1 hypothetical protein OQ292_22145 [Chondrinema litorale]